MVGVRPPGAEGGAGGRTTLGSQMFLYLNPPSVLRFYTKQKLQVVAFQFDILFLSAGAPVHPTLHTTFFLMGSFEGVFTSIRK